MYEKRRFGERSYERHGYERRGPPRERSYHRPLREGAGPAMAGPTMQPPMREEEPHEGITKISSLVLPGEKLADTAKSLPFSFVEGGATFSAVVGLYDGDMRLVPLAGTYLPNLDDYVIGVVDEVKFAGYNIDIKCPYKGFLSNKETRIPFKLGDVILARAYEVDEVKNVNLTDTRKLEGGEIVEILSVKVPRVIGKRSSMLQTIQQATGSEIIVGKNGRIWLRGGNSALAVEAILKIEKEAHIPGLTDRVAAFLKENSNGAI